MLELVLFVVAVIGHAAFLTAGMNCVFGHPLPRRILKPVRPIVGVLIVAGPVLLAWRFGWSLSELRGPLSPVPYIAMTQAYLVICWLVGGLVLPSVTVTRWLWPAPRALLLQTHRVIDFAPTAASQASAGRWKARLAHWPGNQAFQVEWTTLTLAPTGWPDAWDGLVILHLSDLHFHDTLGRAFYEQVLDQAMLDGVPDLICLTGDLVESERHHRWIVPLLGRLRWREGAYAILGNHDYWFDTERIRRRLRRIGVVTLGNGWQQQSLRGLPLTVIGNEVPWGPGQPNLSGCPEQGYRLLLSHSPDQIPWARRHGVGLMLSGHVHGGQIRVPGLGSIFVPSRFSRRYDQGTFEEPPTLLHVSRGLAGREPLRYFCRPQITRLILRSPTRSA